MQKKNEARVLGPYKDVKRWRIVIVQPGGQRTVKLYCSKDKALQGMPRALVKMQSHIALAQHIEPFLDTLRARDLAASTIAANKGFLVNLLADETPAMWTPKRVEQTLALWAKHWSVATRRLNLWRAQTFWAWLQKQGRVAKNPWAGQQVLGRAGRGKAQLRLDEARKLCRVCIEAYSEGNKLAAAPVIMLGMGLRSSEILDRVGRDVDDGGRILWIPSGKTQNARRTLDVPIELQPLLADVCQGTMPEAPIFGLNSVGKPWRPNALWQLLHQLCNRARIPRCCPHSLRGLWASLSLRSGVACSAVAAALGHASFEITARHYAAPGALDDARSEKASSQLFPKHSA